MFERLIAGFQHSKREQVLVRMMIEDLERRPGAADRLEAKRQAHRDLVRTHEEMRTGLAKAFYLLSENIVRYAHYELVDEQDAIQEGVLISFEKIDRFDPSKGKAFNYMTTCIWNHYRQLYRLARNYTRLQKRYQDVVSARADKVFQNRPVRPSAARDKSHSPW